MVKGLHVHFMGIGGSGMAPVAMIAKSMGYRVSGCDMSASGYYCGTLLENGVDICVGHSEEHLQGVDILAVTPAIFDLNPSHPEIVEAGKKNILMTWQQFLGEYIQKDKYVVAVAGTHGKSTTTVLLGAALEHGGLDPYVEAGTVYKPWGGGFRIGGSEYFVCEADEFNNNFHHFRPSMAVINNIEMDHPEFFKDFQQVKDSFKVFVRNMKHPGTLIVNEESQGIREMLVELEDYLTDNNIKVIGYYMNNSFEYPFYKEYKGNILSSNTNNTVYLVSTGNWGEEFELGITGIHNISNSLGVIAAAIELGMKTEAVKAALKGFRGIGRRSEFIGEVNGVRYFDDYAHHPTAVSVMLDSFRASYRNSTLWAIMEPHQISRIRLFFNEFSDALGKADRVVITKTYVGREKYKNIEPIDMGLMAEKIGSKAIHLEDFEEVAKLLKAETKPGDVVVIFGAGESYKLTRMLINK
ncbi:MAG: UDP-N-acetylmuramate--L-alanine ligase [Bacillota bacterium]